MTDDRVLEKIIIAEDMAKINKALHTLFNSNKLTETQKRRFIMYFNKNMAYREVAKIDGVSHKCTYDSVKYALKKLQDMFNKI